MLIDAKTLKEISQKALLAKEDPEFSSLKEKVENQINLAALNGEMKTTLSVGKFSPQCRGNIRQYLTRAGYKADIKQKEVYWVSEENFKLEWVLEIDWS